MYKNGVDFTTIESMVVIGGGFRTRRGRGPGYPLKRSKKGSESKDKQTQTRPYTTQKSPHLPLRRSGFLNFTKGKLEEIGKRLQF